MEGVFVLFEEVRLTFILVSTIYYSNPTPLPLRFNSSGSLKSPSVASKGGMFWVGDQNTAWDGNDGLASVLTAYLTAGSSGFALTHSDVGGYTSLNVTKEWEGEDVNLYVGRTSELIKRWMELSAVADCMFRTHEGNQGERESHVPSVLTHHRQLTHTLASLASRQTTPSLGHPRLNLQPKILEHLPRPPPPPPQSPSQRSQQIRIPPRQRHVVRLRDGQLRNEQPIHAWEGFTHGASVHSRS